MFVNIGGDLSVRDSSIIGVFDLDKLPDSTWTFIDSKTVQLSEGYVPPIHDFSMTRVSDGEDITDSLRDREQLRRLLTLDRSTGILNRMGLEHVMSRKVHEAIHEGGHLSLVMIRVENFRIIHETKGWLSGRRTGAPPIQPNCNGSTISSQPNSVAATAMPSPSGKTSVQDALTAGQMLSSRTSIPMTL